MRIAAGVVPASIAISVSGSAPGSIKTLCRVTEQTSA
jgi:hypothetical protein